MFYIMTIFILFCWLGLSLLFAFLILSLTDEAEIYNGTFFILAFLPFAYSFFAIEVFLIYSPGKPKGYKAESNELHAINILIRDTASRIGFNGTIDDVLLTPGTSIKVYYEPNLKNIFSNSSCKLYIGVGLCHYLSQRELQAVIGHELAHFAQPQTKYKATSVS